MERTNRKHHRLSLSLYQMLALPKKTIPVSAPTHPVQLLGIPAAACLLCLSPLSGLLDFNISLLFQSPYSHTCNVYARARTRAHTYTRTHTRSVLLVLLHPFLARGRYITEHFLLRDSTDLTSLPQREASAQRILSSSISSGDSHLY